MAKVESDPGYLRIDALPRRIWTEPSKAAVQAYYTEAFRKPHGKQMLRPVQAQSLHETIEQRGFLGPIAVGHGKTLYSFLAFVALLSKRPLLLLPGALVNRTRQDLHDLAPHWKLPGDPGIGGLSIESYDKLSRVEYLELLNKIKPDVIVADEAHRLKNKDAACTKRLARYIESNQDTVFCAVSGTLLSKDLKDFAHISAWALREKSPVPYEIQTLDTWCAALDDTAIMGPHPGILLNWTPPHTEGNLRERARAGIRERMTQSPGVVVSLDESYSGSLNIQKVEINIPGKVQEYYRDLRAQWITPDGWELLSPVEVWRHARELALGMHYIWDPRPPQEWRSARKAWGAVCRSYLGAGAQYDTELQLKNALWGIGPKASHLKDPMALRILNEWMNTEPSFTPNSVPVWHDDWTLNYCAQWGKKPGIIWVDHLHFARELAKRTGLAYYGNKGQDQFGNEIEKHDPKRCMIASVDANCTGRNLQAWSRNLIVSPRSNHKVEQLLGRTHRNGQTADEITVDVLYGCRENVVALHRAIAKAREIQQILGAKQKILLAKIDWPSPGELHRLKGSQYQETESLTAEQLLSILDDNSDENEETDE